MQARRIRTLKRRARILIVDDHPMMRIGLAAQISDEPDLEVCGQAEDVNDALAATNSTRPDLAIIDIALKEGHGIDLVKEIKSRFPHVKMLALSAYPESLYAERALRAGALGYLNKQETGEKIFQAIRTVLAGDRYVSPEMTRRLVDQAIGAADPAQSSPVATLSDRELEIFRLIGQGLTTGAIARRLHISTHTVDTHREKMKRKLNARNAAELSRQAVRWVLENG
jgi:DNA-binding NarL/FixJ family response regulator